MIIALPAEIPLSWGVEHDSLSGPGPPGPGWGQRDLISLSDEWFAALLTQKLGKLVLPSFVFAWGDPDSCVGSAYVLGRGGSPPWQWCCTPHGACPKSTPRYGAISTRLWGSAWLFCWWHLSVQRSRFPCAPLKGCCFHQQVSSTAFGEGLHKDLFSQKLLRKVFSQSWVKTWLSEEPKQCWGGTAAGSSPLILFALQGCCLLPLQQEEPCLPAWVLCSLCLLCGSVPISTCGCASDTGGINQKEILDSWEMGTNLLTALLMKLQTIVLLPVLVVLCICMGLQKWGKAKQSWQPNPSVGFLFLYFLDHYLPLPGSLCLSSKQLISWKRFLSGSSHLQLSCLDISGEEPYSQQALKD